MIAGEDSEVERVLIADDHPLVRDGLRSVITVAFDACEIFEAASLEETLKLIERDKAFDLVLLDVHMPGTSGTMGLIEIRRRFPSLPVVMVSAAIDHHLMMAALSAGASGFIPKSLRRAAIVDALRSLQAGDIFVPPEMAEPVEGEESRRIRSRIERLTPQQKVVLGYLVSGKLNKQIAYELDVSMTTVKAHVSAILAKLEVFSRTQAVILAGKIRYEPAFKDARHR
jgi:DNA-binding NarL/FixJ family response regulator